SLGSVTATTTATVTSAGAIEELDTDRAAGRVAPTMSLTAISGIGAVATIEIDATTLSATVTGAAAIDLSDVSGGLSVTTATTPSGAISLNAVGGDLSLSTVSTGAGAVALSTTTSGNVSLGSVTATTTATVTSAGAIEEL